MNLLNSIKQIFGSKTKKCCSRNNKNLKNKISQNINTTTKNNIKQNKNNNVKNNLIKNKVVKSNKKNSKKKK